MGYWKSLYNAVLLIIKSKVLRGVVSIYALIILGSVFVGLMIAYMGVNIISILLLIITFFFLVTYSAYKYIKLGVK